QLGFQSRIDAKQELELDAAVLDVVQEGNVVRRVAEVQDGIRIGCADVVEQNRVVRGLGRHALVKYELHPGVRFFDELAHRVGLRPGEVVGGIEHSDALDAQPGTVVGEKIR